MQPGSPYPTTLNDAIIWIVVALIAIFGLRYVKDFLVFALMKLYEFFIQHNAEGL